MELHDAIQLIRPAVTAPGATWADFGAGNGIFSRALAEIIGPAGRVLAVDREAAALRALRRLEAATDRTRAPISAIPGDVRNLDAIAELAALSLDGALFGNVLHFLPDAAAVVARAAAHVRPGGRVIVIEYDGRPPSRWVPYPLSIDRFFAIVQSAGLRNAEVIGERRSAYRGTLYCAAATRPDHDAATPRSRDTTAAGAAHPEWSAEIPRGQVTRTGHRTLQRSKPSSQSKELPFAAVRASLSQRLFSAFRA